MALSTQSTVDSSQSRVRTAVPNYPDRALGCRLRTVNAKGVARTFLYAFAICLIAALFAPPLARLARTAHDRILANVTRLHIEQIAALCRNDPAAIDTPAAEHLFINGWGGPIHLLRELDAEGTLHYTIASNAGGSGSASSAADFLWEDGQWLRNGSQPSIQRAEIEDSAPALESLTFAVAREARRGVTGGPGALGPRAGRGARPRSDADSRL